MRDRILENAARLFVSNGFTAVSMREIAEAVGVSKAGLYYHFADKEGLMVTVLHEYLKDFSKIVNIAKIIAPDSYSRIKFLITEIFAQPAERRAIIRLASQEIGNLSPSVRADFNIVYHAEFIGQIESILKDGMQQGEIQHTAPEMLTWILLGMMYPFFYPNTGRNSAENTVVVDTLLQIFFDGIREKKTV